MIPWRPIIAVFTGPIITNFYRPRSRGDNTFGNVRVCVGVCPSVCLFEPFDLLTVIFGMKVDLELG